MDDGSIPPVTWACFVGDDEYPLGHARVSEGLSSPYRIDVELEIPQRADLDELLGAHLQLRWRRGGTERRFDGVILEVHELGATRDGVVLRIHAGPPILEAAACYASRIFQHLDVVDVASRVLGPWLTRRGWRLDRASLRSSLDVRDYCVQYRESDLAFAERILAEEGIGYAFAHDGEGPLLVLFDDPEAFPLLSATGQAPGEVHMNTHDDELASAESLATFEHQRAAGPGTTSTWTWDWRSNPPTGWVEMRSAADANATELENISEWFEDHRTHEDRSGRPRHTSIDRAARALGSARVALQRGTARSNVIALAPGHRFVIRGPVPATFAGPWWVESVKHERLRGRVGYRNVATCGSAQAPFTPRPRTRPRVDGIQLGTVTGPAQETIHTDRHGRVRVLMHWDHRGRSAHTDDSTQPTSCWLRVAQSWSGAGLGAQFVPRVGMEVVIAFVDGDPDRPLVVGTLANGENTSPFELPDDATRSGWRTRSVGVDAVGYNEVSFEDAAGDEQIRLHAQRNLDETIRRHHTTTVGGDQDLHVVNDRGALVGRDDHLQIGRNLSVEIAGHSHHVVAGSHQLVVSGGSPFPAAVVPGMFVQVESGIFRLEAEAGIILSCGGSELELRPDGIRIRTIAQLDLVASASSVSLTPTSLGMAAGIVSLASSGGSIGLDDRASIRASGGVWVGRDEDNALVLDGNATLLGHDVSLEAAASASVRGASAEMSAQTIAVHGTDAVSLTGEREVTVTDGLVQGSWSGGFINLE